MYKETVMLSTLQIPLNQTKRFSYKFSDQTNDPKLFDFILIL